MTFLSPIVAISFKIKYHYPGTWEIPPIPLEIPIFRPIPIFPPIPELAEREEWAERAEWVEWTGWAEFQPENRNGQNFPDPGYV